MNKNGWGLRAELGFVLFFLICILISTIGLRRMGLLDNAAGVYTDSDSSINNGINYDYDALEKQVVDAAEKYFEKNYSGEEGTITINTAALISNGYLSSITDSRGRDCSGYAMRLPNGNIVSYIKCGFYKTTGYSEEYE